MLSKLLQTANLFHLLFIIDSALAAIKRKLGVPIAAALFINQTIRANPVAVQLGYRRSIAFGGVCAAVVKVVAAGVCRSHVCLWDGVCTGVVLC